MKPLSLVAMSAIALAACAPATTRTTPAPVPAPAPAPSPVGRTSPVPPTQLLEAPREWQLLDPATDRIAGMSVERAYNELLAGRQPQRTVVVAVIDGGVDTAHVDLKANLWANPGETPGNDRDDDSNGYVDDVRGWNFIGGANGQDVHYDTFELTRLYALCQAGQSNPRTPDAQKCSAISADFQKTRAEVAQTLPQIRGASAALSQAVEILKQAMNTDSLSVAAVTAFRANTPQMQQARQIYLQLAGLGITPESIVEAEKAYEAQLKYNLDPSFNSRTIVGDDYKNLSERIYGNADVTGPDAMHGTHVSGIVAAIRGNGIGVDGIASNVRIMAVRTVPDGDERDKDVANAIRYAVDNGANIINMSFGKAYSPQKGAVDDAVKYADAHGVLMIHAAGNDGADAGEQPSYPTPFYESGGRAANWIDVGAASWKGGDSLVASFSTYGSPEVDVFAPGVDVLSTVPGNGYEREDGTSMAAPMVSGLAALIMAYYPNLTAADVKRIILATAIRHPDQQVILPGAPPSGRMVPFGTLSATGGIVNAYAALQMAEKEK